MSGRSGVPLVVVRPGVVYGPGRDWISSRIGLRLGDRLLQMGGRHLVPYTYINNCQDAICLAGTTPGIAGEAFNVLDDDLPSANALLRRHLRDVGRLRVTSIPSSAIHRYDPRANGMPGNQRDSCRRCWC